MQNCLPLRWLMTVRASLTMSSEVCCALSEFIRTLKALMWLESVSIANETRKLVSMKIIWSTFWGFHKDSGRALKLNRWGYPGEWDISC